MFPLAVLPSLIGLAIRYAPGILDTFVGGSAGKTMEKVTKIAKEVLGTADAKEAEAKLAVDPGLAEQFAARLNAETEQLRIELQDVANARAMQLGLVHDNSFLSYVPAILSALIVMVWAGLTFALFFIHLEIPEKIYTLLTASYGGANFAFGQVIQFWLGSSRSSQRKDSVIGALTPNNGNITLRTGG